MIREPQILDQAIEGFQMETGILIKIIGTEMPIKIENLEIERGYNLRILDAMLNINGKTYVAEIKAAIRRENVGAILQQVEVFEGIPIIVTGHVTTNLATYLRERNIAFLDTAGNAFINDPPLYIYVKGNKIPDQFKLPKRNRAFQPTGLKVVFALLANPDLENAAYRQIAQYAKVANGTVGWVVNDLKQLGYLVDMGKHHRRRLIKKEDLLRRWVEAYPEILKPKLLLGRYTTKHANMLDNWFDHKYDTMKVEWGGEIAAAKLTKYLKPQNATIYTKGTINEFVLKNQLMKDPNGNVEILEQFWNFHHPYQELNIVHPLLVYADLLATGDARNIETAKIIYEEEIAKIINKD